MTPLCQAPLLTPSLHWPLGPVDGRMQVRRWLMAGAEVNDRDDQGRPAWVGALLAGHPEAVEELMDAGAHLLDRDAAGQGWMHWGLRAGLSPTLVVMGLQRLDDRWWHPDCYGDTPFHLPSVPLEVAQAMGARLWSDRVPWAQMARDRDPVALAQDRGTGRLAQVWAEWRGRCSPRSGPGPSP